MTPAWNPCRESWGLPYSISARDAGTHTDAGPLAIGRVFGNETVAIEDALNRVASADISAQLAVPCRPLAAVRGNAIHSGDTQTANEKRRIHLDDLGRIAHLVGTVEAEPVLPPQQSHAVEPFSLLLPGADAVLSHTSAHYQGASVRDKLKMKIIEPVPAGTDVIGIGADFAAGEPLLYQGRRVSPGDIAALCMAGVRTIQAVARPRVAVCTISKYFQQQAVHDSTSALPDGVTPMVLATLARWGVKVDTVRNIDFAGQVFRQANSEEINSISEEHDLTITLGFLGDKLELNSFRSQQQMDTIEEPQVSSEADATYSRSRGLYKPAGIARVFRGGEYWKSDTRPDRCKVVVALQGLPLPVFASMYTVIKPILDALSGVGAYPVAPANHFGFNSPKDLGTFPNADEKRKFLSRPKNGMSERHGVRWLTGTLSAPAPRAPDRHWLQLAKLSKVETGAIGLQVLPSEEFQVSGLIGAEAMVAIEKGDGDMPIGTVVQYFMLD
jgi:molybdopterin molybdotransferase